MLDTIYRPDFSGTTFHAGGDEGSLVSALTEIQSFLGEPNSDFEESLIPTLFGRERNQELLVAALERRFTYTCSEFVSLVGTSGCGKTSLAESLRSQVAQRHAYFAMGKFPQFTWSNIPYSAIVEAVTNLIDAVLEREDDLENSRRAVRNALGDNIYLLTPLISNLAQLAGIIGFEASATNGLSFAFDRVKLSFCELFKALATPWHPIVLVMDDIHHADSASLDILKAILADSHHLLIMVTSRPDDKIVQDICGYCTLRTTELVIRELRETEAYFVTASYLKEDSSSISDLSEICHSKTNGNPYFLHQFLYLLQKKELLTCKNSTGSNSWTWDCGKVRDEAIRSGNVLEVIDQIISLLHPLIQQFLQIAACVGVDVLPLEIVFDAMRHQKSTTNAIHEILQVAASMGHRFQRMTTELIYGAVEQQNGLETIDESTEIQSCEGSVLSVPNLPSIQVAVCLACCTKMGLLQTDGEEKFKFSHDRVQQALCESLGDAKAEKHLAIGRILRQHEKFNPSNPDFFFLVVDQLNAGSTKIVSEDAKVSLISLNVEAAVIAAEHSAYMSAQRYLLQALSFQPINIMWETEYELMLECSTLAAEMDLACGKYAEAINRVDQILRNATSIQDQHQALFTKVTALIATREIGLAHNLTLNAIIALSSKFPAKPKKSHVNLEITRTSAALSSISEEQILGLQPMVIAIQTTEVKLLRILSWCSFRRGDGEMMAVTAFRIVQLTIVNGFCDVTPFAFAICGLVHCFLKNVKDASYFASLSIQGLERVTDTQITAQTLHVVWSFVGHLSCMPSEVHAGLLRSYTLAKLSGDSDLTFLCALNCCASSLLLGSENLEVVLGFVRTAFEDTSQKNYKDTDNNIYRILFQASNNIATSSSFPCRLTGEIMAEEIMLQDALEKNDDLTHYALWYVKLFLCAIFDKWEAAEDLVDKINESHKCLHPHFSLFHYWMLAGLTYTIRYNITKKRKYRRNIKLFRKQLNDAIEKGVASCEPMFALLLAEESALSGNLTTIMNSYDFAANSFAKDKRFNYQALTYERASRNIMRLFPSNLSDAQRYVMKARQAYVSWGANCKVAFIDEEIIRLRGPSSSSTIQNDASTHVSESCDGDGSTKIVNG